MTDKDLIAVSKEIRRCWNGYNRRLFESANIKSGQFQKGIIGENFGTIIKPIKHDLWKTR
jgi:hypothetical protein